MRMMGGRSLGLTLIDLGMGQGIDGNAHADVFLEAADAFLMGVDREEVSRRQVQYVLRRYAGFSNSEAVRRLSEQEVLLERWLRDENVGDGFASGEGYFSRIDEEARFAFVFPLDSVVSEGRSVESIRDGMFRLSLSEEAGADAVSLAEPLGFLALERLDDAAAESMISSDKSGLYFWIGGIVLGLSIVSGVAIVASIRRQASVTRLKDNLVATVTHELKTPVASIRLLVDTLLDEERRGKVDTQEYIELISRENLRLGRLIDNFLSFSRMERSKAGFDIEVIDAASVVASAEEAFRERFTGQRFSLDVEIEKGLREISGEVDALATVLGNLLENAFKYGGRDREIVLRAVNAEDGVEFQVEDFGMGIPKKEQKRIFRKFYRSERGGVAQDGSVGLGLSIVQFIVSKHSGQVEIESDEGVGSIFKVRIPYA